MYAVLVWSFAFQMMHQVTPFATRAEAEAFKEQEIRLYSDAYRRAGAPAPQVIELPKEPSEE